MTEQLALFISPLALRPYPVAISLIFFEGIPAMLNKTQAAQIDLLRNAAKEHPVVTRLLFALNDSLMLPENGDNAWTGEDEEDVQLVVAAQMAAVFAQLDCAEGEIHE